MGERSTAIPGPSGATIARGAGGEPPAVVYQLRAWSGHAHANDVIRRLPRHPAMRRLWGLQEPRRLQVVRDVGNTGILLEPCTRGFYDLAKAKAPIAMGDAAAHCRALCGSRLASAAGAAADRLAVRQAESKPLVADLRIWFQAQMEKLPGRSPTAEAIRYALNHWVGLERFLHDGRIELDNNSVERAMRPVCLSRKNSLFAASDEGAENWACLASLVETCKLNHVNPMVYFTDLLTRLVKWVAAEAHR